jgi:hypothetical protein
MGWELLLVNRIRLGFLVGWSHYWANEEFDYSEIVLHLGFVSLNLKIWTD